MGPIALLREAIVSGDTDVPARGLLHALVRRAPARRSPLVNRSALVTRVAADITEARTVALTALTRCEEIATIAWRRQESARAGAADVGEELSVVRATGLRGIAGRFGRRRTGVVNEIDALIATLPPAVASGWSQWFVDTAPSRSRAPELLRVGRLMDEPTIPALVPLLDAGHVAIEGDDAIAEAIVTGLLLRALGSVPPEMLRITVHTVEPIGLDPLYGTGIVDVTPPDHLDAMLDAALEHIARVNEDVLAGAYGTVREQSIVTGSRTVPWHLIVLGDPGAAEPGRLERVVRTGPACGVHVIGVGGLPASAPPRSRRSAAGPVPPRPRRSARSSRIRRRRTT